MKLLNRLEEYSKSPAYPFHMPGHKRRMDSLDPRLPWQLDITEIDGFDNLHSPSGILKDGMDRAARLYHSRRTFFLVNGSTCGILAAVCAATAPGDTVLMARGCHKSVYHAVELRGLTPVYLMPSWDDSFGVFGSITPAAVEQALCGNPKIRLVILTSPTYEGVLSDIAAIAQIAHRHGVPLLVDEAHGAHLGFDSRFPQSAVALGADIVIQSLHKTLPSLTQTALAHLGGEMIDERRFARQLAVFETSSPSYLLMGSIESCLELLKSPQELFSPYWERLERFSGAMKQLQNLRVLCCGEDSPARHPAFFAFDPSKLVISTKGTGLTGPALSQLLRERYRLELEMAMGDYALAMTSVCDTDEGFTRLSGALLAVDAQTGAKAAAKASPIVPLLPRQRLIPAKAALLPGSPTPTPDCGGLTSAQSVWAYPPGIPLLVPGEEISQEFLLQMQELENQGVALYGDYGSPAESLRTLDLTQQDFYG